MSKSKFELYEFDVPEGWIISKNDFVKIDPLDDISDDDKFFTIYSVEKMLLIENHNFHLDLGWYGGENGQYSIHFFKGSWLVSW